jgi:hypothetical protein
VQVAASSVRTTINFNEHPAARGRTDVNQRSTICAVRAWVDSRGRLNKELDRHAAGRDPVVSSIDVQAVAITDRPVMYHEAALAVSRPGPQVIEAAAFVVNDG